jgi:hypothetical protein
MRSPVARQPVVCRRLRQTRTARRALEKGNLLIEVPLNPLVRQVLDGAIA